MTDIPDQMTAVMINKYGRDGLSVEQVPVPQPGPGQVLIKMSAAPINPSDIGLILGLASYLDAPLPAVAGIEGAGTVIKTDGSMMGRYLMGKNVACTRAPKSTGTWAEYMVTSVNAAFPLGKGVGPEQGSMSIINPLTALTLIEIAKQGGHRTIINTAAASTLGQMLLRLASKEGIQMVHIVRREEQVELLKGMGATMILNSTDEDFEDQLQALCKEHKIRLALDAIAGSMTNTLLSAILSGGEVVLYSKLSRENPKLEFNNIVGPDNRMSGFLLSTWMAKQPFLKKLRLTRQSQSLMVSDLRSDIRARVSLTEVPQAIVDYGNNMTGGKVIILPGS